MIDFESARPRALRTIPPRRLQQGTYGRLTRFPSSSGAPRGLPSTFFNTDRLIRHLFLDGLAVGSNYVSMCRFVVFRRAAYELAASISHEAR